MKVESKIPLPARFPFKDMKVGDSFAVPPGVNRTTVGVAATRYGRKHGMTFTVRIMPDRSFRCWRVS